MNYAEMTFRWSWSDNDDIEADAEMVRDFGRQFMKVMAGRNPSVIATMGRAAAEAVPAAAAPREGA